MLQQFSWGHFLIALMVGNVLWYGLVLLIFYRKELQRLARGDELGRGGGTVAPSRADGQGMAMPERGPMEQNLPAGNALMGPSRLPVGVEVVSSDQLVFAGEPSADRYAQVGLVADVVQELKGIFAELEKKAGDKRDFFSMLQEVKETYGSLAGYPGIGAINAFIREAAPFHLSKEELDNLWY